MKDVAMTSPASTAASAAATTTKSAVHGPRHSGPAAIASPAAGSWSHPHRPFSISTWHDFIPSTKKLR
jgi:hypothetical protein